MTTPHNHVLIDYENVQPEVASRLAPGFFKVWVFVGALQNKVKFDLLDPRRVYQLRLLLAADIGLQ